MAKQSLHGWWQNWLTQRFGVNTECTLAQKDILIFIYQQGYLYLVLILITFIAGVNYANNLILGFCFFISAILCISFYVTFKQLHGLKLEIIYPEVGQVGTVLELKIQLQQEQSTSRYLYFSFSGQIQKVRLSEKQQQLILYFFPEQRGEYRFPTIRIYSLYPLGLVRAWSYLYVQQRVWIAPDTKTFPAEGHATQRSDQHELDEFYELRDFKAGDSYQAVSWKQLARGQGLYVKLFEAQAQDQHVLIDYAQMPSAEHEERLRLMMGLVEQCERGQQPYRLRLPKGELPSGLGMAHYQQMQKQLAQA